MARGVVSAVEKDGARRWTGVTRGWHDAGWKGGGGSLPCGERAIEGGEASRLRCISERWHEVLVRQRSLVLCRAGPRGGGEGQGGMGVPRATAAASTASLHADGPSAGGAVAEGCGGGVDRAIRLNKSGSLSHTALTSLLISPQLRCSTLCAHFLPSHLTFLNPAAWCFCRRWL